MGSFVDISYDPVRFSIRNELTLRWQSRPFAHTSTCRSNRWPPSRTRANEQTTPSGSLTTMDAITWRISVCLSPIPSEAATPQIRSPTVDPFVDTSQSFHTIRLRESTSTGTPSSAGHTSGRPARVDSHARPGQIRPAMAEIVFAGHEGDDSVVIPVHELACYYSPMIVSKKSRVPCGKSTVPDR